MNPECSGKQLCTFRRAAATLSLLAVAADLEPGEFTLKTMEAVHCLKAPYEMKVVGKAV